MVKGTWKRGHAARFKANGTCAGPSLLPGRDVPDDDLDLGLIGPPPPAPAAGTRNTGTGAARGRAGSVRMVSPDGVIGDDEPDDDLFADFDLDEDVPADPPPLHVAPSGGQRGKQKQAGHSQRRVTVNVKRDIEAKLGMMLLVPGKVWEARDPVCGAQFVASVPDIRAAAVELICQSPDLIEFFMGAGGGFMLWLNLLVACQPVVMTVWMHHIAHSITKGEDGQYYQQVDASQYAA